MPANARSFLLLAAGLTVPERAGKRIGNLASG